MEGYPYNEDTEDIALGNKIEYHWKMGFEDNSGGVDDEKSLLHSKIWYV